MIILINSSEHLKDTSSPHSSRKQITEKISREIMGNDVVWEDGHC